MSFSIDPLPFGITVLPAEFREFEHQVGSRSNHRSGDTPLCPRSAESTSHRRKCVPRGTRPKFKITHASKMLKLVSKLFMTCTLCYKSKQTIIRPRVDDRLKPLATYPL